MEKIIIRDFRNIGLQELSFSPNVNCISGGNGEGKTNLLEAVWYLSMTKSAFTSGDKFNFRHGTSSFSMAGTYCIPGDRHTRITVQVSENGEKILKRDDKQYGKISEHIGLLPVVMVSPSDTSLVSESGEERRKFANAVLSQTDRPYLRSIQEYNRILLLRNRHLKEGFPDDGLLDVLDKQLSDAALPVYERRKEFAKMLAPLAGKYCSEISAGAENVGIEYRSDLSKGSLEDLLRDSRDRDKILKYTTCGIQRDDFLFQMDGYPLRRCGSQGQQKSFLVALKFAQYDIMKKSYGYAPILLLDDLFDKLDFDRVRNLLQMVSGNDFGQIFLSDSSKVRIRSIVEKITSESICFSARGGVFSIEQA